MTPTELADAVIRNDGKGKHQSYSATITAGHNVDGIGWASVEVIGWGATETEARDHLASVRTSVASALRASTDRAGTMPSEEEIAQAICKAAGWDWKDEVTLNAGFMSCARAVLALPKGSSEPPSVDTVRLALCLRTPCTFPKCGCQHSIHTIVRVLAGGEPTLTCSWQPIETAPKDGTEIMIFSQGHGRKVARWDTGGFFEGWYIGMESRKSCAGTYAAQVTHWQPLDAPPVPTSGEPCR